MNNHFTIIIPSYNVEKWIDNTLSSALNQDYDNFDVIFMFKRVGVGGRHDERRQIICGGSHVRSGAHFNQRLDHIRIRQDNGRGHRCVTGLVRNFRFCPARNEILDRMDIF